MPDEHGWDQGLSPTEQLILQYISEGLRDAEIAVRLAIPTGDAKERVARLVEKLGVPDRAALADWRRQHANLPGPRQAKRPIGQATDSPSTVASAVESEIVVMDDAGERLATRKGLRRAIATFTAAIAIAGVALLTVSLDGEPGEESELELTIGRDTGPSVTHITPPDHIVLSDKEIDLLSGKFREHPEWFVPWPAPTESRTDDAGGEDIWDTLRSLFGLD